MFPNAAEDRTRIRAAIIILEPYNPMTPYAETQKERRKNSQQSIHRIPKDSGVAQGMPRGTFLSTTPPDLLKLEYIVDFM